jgi:hypothetical protein
VGTDSFYGHYFSFEPYIDLVNVVFRPSFGYHFFPLASGSGADSVSTFKESSRVGSFDYGIRVQLAPWVAKNLRSRAFFSLGFWKSATRGRNTRNYGTNVSYSESVHGTGTTVAAGAGFETFLLQNYSLQLEGGYSQRIVDSFAYHSTSDVAGVARSSGEAVLNSSFRNKALHLWAPYLQLGLNLNF